MHRTGLPLSQAQLLKWRPTTRSFHCGRCCCSEAWGNNSNIPPRIKRPAKDATWRPPASRAPGVPRAPAKRPDESSIFAQLFGEKSSSDNGASPQKPISISSSRQENTRAPTKTATAEQDSNLDETTGTSIYDQLFSNDEATASKVITHRGRVTKLARRPAESIEREDRNSNTDPKDSEDFNTSWPENTVSISIRNHFRNWALEEGILPKTVPQVREHGSHSTVLVLSSVSPNLQESDFYRIAPQGQHLEGWSNGLMKVIQVHDPNTHQPQGQYFLFFHTKPFALAYMEKVKHLHKLARDAMFAGRRKVESGSIDPPFPQFQQEDEEALRAFTLVPPSIDLDIGMRLWGSDFVREALEKSNIQDVFQESGARPTTECKVALSLSRGGLTLHDLRLAIEEDGKSRNLPWKLQNAWDSIMPIKMIVSGELEKARRVWGIEGTGAALPMVEEKKGSGQAGKESDENTNERFPRFLLTFANAAESRRFARNWHKRTVHDDVNRWTVEADATALW